MDKQDKGKIRYHTEGQVQYFTSTSFARTAEQLLKLEEEYLGFTGVLGRYNYTIVAVMASEPGLFPQILVEYEDGHRGLRPLRNIEREVVK